MKSLVLGAQGQDGRFLSAAMRRRGHDVIGVDCRAAKDDPALVVADLRDGPEFSKLLQRTQPDIVFHLAAVHGAAGSSYEDIWGDMLAVNVATVHRILEYQRTCRPQARLLYANSAKVFGATYPERIDETTPQSPACLYGITKRTAGDLIAYYRERHAIEACVLYLFNHESALRPPDFFIPKLVAILAGAIADPHHSRTVQTLEFHCDRGSAAEYMDLAAALAETSLTEDYVLGSGRCVSARALADTLFRRFGLDYRNHVVEAADTPPAANPSYAVVTDRLRRQLGRVPTTTIEDVCLDILRSNHGIGYDHL